MQCKLKAFSKCFLIMFSVYVVKNNKGGNQEYLWKCFTSYLLFHFIPTLRLLILKGKPSHFSLLAQGVDQYELNYESLWKPKSEHRNQKALAKREEVRFELLLH